MNHDKDNPKLQWISTPKQEQSLWDRIKVIGASEKLKDKEWGVPKPTLLIIDDHQGAIDIGTTIHAAIEAEMEVIVAESKTKAGVFGRGSGKQHLMRELLEEVYAIDGTEDFVLLDSLGSNDDYLRLGNGPTEPEDFKPNKTITPHHAKPWKNKKYFKGEIMSDKFIPVALPKHQFHKVPENNTTVLFVMGVENIIRVGVVKVIKGIPWYVKTYSGKTFHPYLSDLIRIGSSLPKIKVTLTTE